MVKQPKELITKTNKEIIFNKIKYLANSRTNLPSSSLDIVLWNTNRRLCLEVKQLEVIMQKKSLFCHVPGA